MNTTHTHLSVTLPCGRIHHNCSIWTPSVGYKSRSNTSVRIVDSNVIVAFIRPVEFLTDPVPGNIVCWYNYMQQIHLSCCSAHYALVQPSIQLGFKQVRVAQSVYTPYMHHCFLYNGHKTLTYEVTRQGCGCHWGRKCTCSCPLADSTSKVTLSFKYERAYASLTTKVGQAELVCWLTRLS